jgi:hypothetical protein
MTGKPRRQEYHSTRSLVDKLGVKPEAKIKDVDVIAAAKAAGLVDNKVVSFSETHTALRLVIPVDQR